VKKYPLLEIDGVITDEKVKTVLKEVKKSSLEGLKDHIESMTPEEWEKWQRDLVESMKKHRTERAEAERKRNGPPETPSGACVFCNNEVKGEYAHGLRPGTDSRFVPIGPGSRQFYGWQFKGYHCHGCGLVYKFPPPKGIVTCQGEAHEIGESAKVDQRRDRGRSRRG
jgi:hypothetical protein